MSELKPCPFCGGEAESREDSDCTSMDRPMPYWVSCTNCQANFYMSDNAEDEWNTKAQQQPSDSDLLFHVIVGTGQVWANADNTWSYYYTESGFRKHTLGDTPRAAIAAAMKNDNDL